MCVASMRAIVCLVWLLFLLAPGASLSCSYRSVVAGACAGDVSDVSHVNDELGGRGGFGGLDVVGLGERKRDLAPAARAGGVHLVTGVSGQPN